MTKIRHLLGVGPVLLLTGVLIEGAAHCMADKIPLSVCLPFQLKIILSVSAVIMFLSGMAWFNATLNLIRVNFLGEDKQLHVHGPFEYVRHPMYSILFFTLPLLVFLWCSDAWFIIAWILLYIPVWYILKIEEKGLIEQFGDTYRQYQQSVPALIPYRGAGGRRHFIEMMKEKV